jgi:hypothetical protein
VLCQLAQRAPAQRCMLHRESQSFQLHYDAQRRAAPEVAVRLQPPHLLPHPGPVSFVAPDRNAECGHHVAQRGAISDDFGRQPLERSTDIRVPVRPDHPTSQLDRHSQAGQVIVEVDTEQVRLRAGLTCRTGFCRACASSHAASFKPRCAAWSSAYPARLDQCAEPATGCVDLARDLPVLHGRSARRGIGRGRFVRGDLPWAAAFLAATYPA